MRRTPEQRPVCMAQGPSTMLPILICDFFVSLLHELDDEVLDHFSTFLAFIAQRAAVSSPRTVISSTSCWMAAVTFLDSAVSSSDSSLFESRICSVVMGSVSQQPLCLASSVIFSAAFSRLIVVLQCRDRRAGRRETEE